MANSLLDNLRRGLARPAGPRLAPQIVRWFYACSGREYSPRGISDSAPGGVGVKLPVVQNVGKIAARFVDLFIQLNAA